MKKVLASIVLIISGGTLFLILTTTLTIGLGIFEILGRPDMDWTLAMAIAGSPIMKVIALVCIPLMFISYPFVVQDEGQSWWQTFQKYLF